MRGVLEELSTRGVARVRAAADLRALVRFEELESRIAPATLPAGFGATVVGEGLSAPVAMAIAPDGRIFVTEKNGFVRVFHNGIVQPTPVLRLTVNSSGERGVLGITLDPNFSSNGFMYVFYTAASPYLHNRLSRFTVTGNTASPSSERVLLEVPIPSATNYFHNGGALAFGPDGKLYVSIGDGTHPTRAQQLDNLNGKILRINKDGSIPTDNPFYNQTTGVNRAIWALGLRNPFTFSFQPGTGRFYANDVGQNAWEEINLIHWGANYGWPTSEGPTSDPQFTAPIHAYRHGTDGAAIAGAAFYNPVNSTFPSSYIGKYFFADYVLGFVCTLDPHTRQVETFSPDLGYGIVDLKTSPDGAIYALNIVQGTLIRIDFLGTHTRPSILRQPDSKLASINEMTSFHVVAIGVGNVTYQWQRNGVNIPGATDRVYRFAATKADDGAFYRVVVTNSFGSVVSDEARLTVADNFAPEARILTPTSATKFRMGDRIYYSGLGLDEEDGQLGGKAFTWTVEYITSESWSAYFEGEGRPRPFMAPVSGSASGFFDIPVTTPFDKTNVSFRIHLRVVDSFGAVTETFVDIKPITTTLTVGTDPAGGTIQVSGQLYTGLQTIELVSGIERELSARETMEINGVTYEFYEWSDGSTERTRTIRVFDEPTTLIARYRVPPVPGWPEPTGSPTPVQTPVDSRSLLPPYQPGDPAFPIRRGAIAVGSGIGGPGTITIIDPTTGVRGDLVPFPGFTGEIRVAVGDVTGDGIPDVIGAAGPNGGPQVAVIDGTSGNVLFTFMAYDPAFLGGIFVATGDVTGNGRSEIVTGTGVGGGAHVKIFDGLTGQELWSFFAYDPAFLGGVNIAVGDLDGDGYADIVTGPGDWGGSHVRVFSGRTGELLFEFFAYDPAFLGGVRVAVGDVNGDGILDIITTPGYGGGSHVKVFAGLSGIEIAGFMAYPEVPFSGATVAALDIDGDRISEIVTGPGLGGGPLVLVFDINGQKKAAAMVFDPAFLGGIYVA